MSIENIQTNNNIPTSAKIQTSLSIKSPDQVVLSYSFQQKNSQNITQNILLGLNNDSKSKNNKKNVNTSGEQKNKLISLIPDPKKIFRQDNKNQKHQKDNEMPRRYKELINIKQNITEQKIVNNKNMIKNNQKNQLIIPKLNQNKSNNKQMNFKEITNVKPDFKKNKQTQQKVFKDKQSDVPLVPNTVNKQKSPYNITVPVRKSIKKNTNILINQVHQTSANGQSRMSNFNQIKNINKNRFNNDSKTQHTTNNVKQPTSVLPTNLKSNNNNNNNKSVLNASKSNQIHPLAKKDIIPKQTIRSFKSISKQNKSKSQYNSPSPIKAIQSQISQNSPSSPKLQRQASIAQNKTPMQKLQQNRLKQMAKTTNDKPFLNKPSVSVNKTIRPASISSDKPITKLKNSLSVSKSPNQKDQTVKNTYNKVNRQKSVMSNSSNNKSPIKLQRILSNDKGNTSLRSNQKGSTNSLLSSRNKQSNSISSNLKTTGIKDVKNSTMYNKNPLNPKNSNQSSSMLNKSKSMSVSSVNSDKSRSISVNKSKIATNQQGNKSNNNNNNIIFNKKYPQQLEINHQVQEESCLSQKRIKQRQSMASNSPTLINSKKQIHDQNGQVNNDMHGQNNQLDLHEQKLNQLQQRLKTQPHAIQKSTINDNNDQKAENVPKPPKISLNLNNANKTTMRRQSNMNKLNKRGPMQKSSDNFNIKQNKKDVKPKIINNKVQNRGKGQINGQIKGNINNKMNNNVNNNINNVNRQNNEANNQMININNNLQVNNNAKIDNLNNNDNTANFNNTNELNTQTNTLNHNQLQSNQINNNQQLNQTNQINNQNQHQNVDNVVNNQNNQVNNNNLQNNLQNNNNLVNTGNDTQINGNIPVNNADITINPANNNNFISNQQNNINNHINSQKNQSNDQITNLQNRPNSKQQRPYSKKQTLRTNQNQIAKDNIQDLTKNNQLIGFKVPKNVVSVKTPAQIKRSSQQLNFIQNLKHKTNADINTLKGSSSHSFDRKNLNDKETVESIKNQKGNKASAFKPKTPKDKGHNFKNWKESQSTQKKQPSSSVVKLNKNTSHNNSKAKESTSKDKVISKRSRKKEVDLDDKQVDKFNVFAANRNLDKRGSKLHKKPVSNISSRAKDFNSFQRDDISDKDEERSKGSNSDVQQNQQKDRQNIQQDRQNKQDNKGKELNIHQIHMMKQQQQTSLSNQPQLKQNQDPNITISKSPTKQTQNNKLSNIFQQEIEQPQQIKLQTLNKTKSNNNNSSVLLNNYRNSNVLLQSNAISNMHTTYQPINKDISTYQRAPILSFIYNQKKQFIGVKNSFKVSKKRVIIDKSTNEEDDNIINDAIQMLREIDSWILDRIIEPYQNINKEVGVWLYCNGTWQLFTNKCTEKDTYKSILTKSIHKLAEKQASSSIHDLQHILTMISGLRIIKLKNTTKKLMTELQYSLKKKHIIKGIVISNNKQKYYQIIGLELSKDKQNIIQIKDQNGGKYWLKQQKFKSFFNYFLLLTNRNVSYWTTKTMEHKDKHKGVVTLTSAVPSYGSVTLYYPSQQTSTLYLYKQLSSKVLKFMGKLEQKVNRNGNLYFEFRLQGKYYLFVQCPINCNLGVQSTKEIQIGQVEYIKSQTLKNQQCQYVQLNNIKRANIGNNMQMSKLKQQFIKMVSK